MSDFPRDELHIGSYAELEAYLRKELSFCGCASANEAIELLRDVLRCARDFHEALSMPDSQERCRHAYLQLKDRLRFDDARGLATWFLYVLDERRLIEHASNVTECWITPKGSRLLDAIEKYYPPSQDVQP